MRREEIIAALERYAAQNGIGFPDVKQAAKEAAELLSQEQSEDCISRQAAADAIPNPWLTSDGRIYNTINIVNKILDLPSVQPMRKMGRWIIQGDKNKKLYGWYVCSCCGAVIEDKKARYCSECGTEMEVE